MTRIVPQSVALFEESCGRLYQPGTDPKLHFRAKAGQRPPSPPLLSGILRSGCADQRVDVSVMAMTWPRLLADQPVMILDFSSF
jgi:hypothetical protein